MGKVAVSLWSASSERSDPRDERATPTPRTTCAAGARCPTLPARARQAGVGGGPPAPPPSARLARALYLPPPAQLSALLLLLLRVTSGALLRLLALLVLHETVEEAGLMFAEESRLVCVTEALERLNGSWEGVVVRHW